MRAGRRLRSWTVFERKVAIWLQGWTLLVTAVFVVKFAVNPEMMTWPVMTAIAASHTAVYILLLFISGTRRRMTEELAAIDARYGAAERG